MVTKDLKKTYDLVSDTEEHGLTRVLKSHFHELMSLGSGPTRNVCRLFRDNLMSTLGLNYFTKLNLLVKNRLVATTEGSRHDICQWIDNDVMEAINGLCETDVFDNPKTLSALCDVAIALNSSLDTIEEEFIDHEIDYLLDIPYQLDDMVKRSSHVPWFYKSSWKREERGQFKKLDIRMSERQVSVSYTMGVRT